jgi:hypothetical protein
MIELYWWPTPNGWIVTTVGGLWPPPLHDHAHQCRPRGPTVSGYAPAFAERSNAANEYKVAGMMCYPWASLWQGRSAHPGEFLNVLHWLAEIGERSAVKKGMCTGGELRQDPESIRPDEQIRRAKLLNHQRAQTVPNGWS